MVQRGLRLNQLRPRLRSSHEPALTIVLTAANNLVQITRVVFTPGVLLGALHKGPSPTAWCD
jgi:hypothetical protein